MFMYTSLIHLGTVHEPFDWGVGSGYLAVLPGESIVIEYVGADGEDYGWVFGHVWAQGDGETKTK